MNCTCGHPLRLHAMKKGPCFECSCTGFIRMGTKKRRLPKAKPESEYDIHEGYRWKIRTPKNVPPDARSLMINPRCQVWHDLGRSPANPPRG